MSKFRSQFGIRNGPAPTKQEILNTLDAFGGDKVPGKTGTKLNNNSRSKIQDPLLNPGQNSTSSAGDDLSSPEKRRMEYMQSMSFSNSYCDEWERLFGKEDYTKNLRSLGLDGLLRSSRFRSVCWRIYLDVLPEDRKKWMDRTRELRAEYTDLRQRLILNPRKEMEISQDLSVNNPLSQDEESPWNKFFQDNELRLTIKQDVIRTFPELEFFQNQKIRELMVNILFCMARENYGLMYKQGMHELLAPLIFVLHCDHQAFLHACELDSVDLIQSDEREVVKELLDPDYLEHDAYAMFCQVMETTEPWYQSRDIILPTKAQAIMSAQPFARPQDLQPSNVIVNKLTRIQDYVLKKHDLELHMHLERLDIAPQIYGIRWLRLLFGREFPMQDLLVIWDAVFADSISFDLVDYIFVGMLLYIRDILLSNDYPSCLGILMRYPAVGDVHYLIDKAMYLRDPSLHPRPPNYTCQRVVQPIVTSHSKPAAKNGNKELPQKPKRKGSTSSLSKMETMRMDMSDEVQPASSTQSLARLETLSLRSSDSMQSVSHMEQFSPEDKHGAKSKSGQLPNNNKSRLKRHKKTNSGNITIQDDSAFHQGRINDLEAMCKYCASKMDIHIEKLQNQLLRQRNLENEDEVFLAVAGIKQVRDVLKGTLRFARNLLDSDEISINDNHYEAEPKPVIDTHIDGDIAMDSAHTSPGQDRHTGEDKKQSVFYVDQVVAEYVNIDEDFDGGAAMTKKMPISLEMRQSLHGSVDEKVDDNFAPNHQRDPFSSSGSVRTDSVHLDARNRNVHLSERQSEENANLFT